MASSATADTPELAAADSAAENLLSRNAANALNNIDPGREASLDAAFAEVVPPGAEPGEIGRDNGGVPVNVPGTPDEKPADEPAPQPDPAPKPNPEPAKPVPKPAEPAARKGLLDDVLDEPTAPAPDTPEKAYDDIKLRSDASPKTQETFNAVKARALERETAVRTELSTATARILELETKLTETEKKIGAVPENIEKELKEHREYRALHDVSSRPEFKEKFDSRIEANYEAIYSILKQEGWTDEKVQALKNFSEAQRVEFIENKLAPLLTAGQKRVVEAKIFDNVNIAEEKAKALAEARTNAEKILAEQREAPAQQQKQRDAEFANVLRPLLQKLPFVYIKEVPSTASPTQKAEIEAHNAFAAELQKDITRAISDQSPEIRAEVILAVPLARHLKREVTTLKARAEAAEAKLAAITKAGNTHRLGKAAPDAAPAPVSRNSDASGDSSVDSLFQQYSGRPAS